MKPFAIFVFYKNVLTEKKMNAQSYTLQKIRIPLKILQYLTRTTENTAFNEMRLLNKSIC